MAKEIVFNLNVNTDLQQVDEDINSIISSTDTLKKQYKELQIAAQKATDPAAFEKYAAAAGALKDQIGDTNQRINAFSSDTQKLDTVVGSVQGVAGAFAAVQGAVGLLGAENEDLNKTLLQVQSSMAVLNGVQQVANTLNKDSVVGAKLHAVANKILNSSFLTVNGGLKAFRIALISTGIGAAVVAVGLLIANFDKIKEVVLKFIPGLSLVGEIFGNIVDAVTDFVGITSEAGRALESLTVSTKGLNEQLERDIKLLEAQGGKEAEIYGKKADLIKNNIKLLEEKLKTGETLNEEELKQQKDLYNELAVLEAQESNRKKTAAQKEKDDLDKINDKAAADRLKKSEEAAQKQAQVDAINAETRLRLIQDTNAKELATYDQKAAAEIEAAKKVNADVTSLLQAQALERQAILDKQAADAKDKSDELAAKELDLLTKQFDARLTLLDQQAKIDDLRTGDATLSEIESRGAAELEVFRAQLDAKLITQEEYDIKELENAKELSDAKIKIAQDEADRKQALNEFSTNAALSALNTLANFNEAFAKNDEKSAKKAFENNKKLQIAQALIQTYQGVQAIFTSAANNPGTILFPAQPFIAAGLALAAGLANVAKIKSTQFGGSGSAAGGGGAAAGGGGIQSSVSNPFANQQASSVITPTGLGSSQNQPQRVYVVESDITRVQNRVEVIENKNRL